MALKVSGQVVLAVAGHPAGSGGGGFCHFCLDRGLLAAGAADTGLAGQDMVVGESCSGSAQEVTIFI